MSNLPGWLDSTMGVIGNATAGVGVGNQPVNGFNSKRTARSPSPLPRQPRTTLRSGSPARLPSEDVLNRSIHNDSNHGNGNKSKDEIIAELKKSNSALTSKLADAEADFMNQCSKLSDELQKKKSLLTQRDDQILTLQSRLASTEKRIRERDKQNSEIKEELSFSRHNITDLKNQIYQLQHDVEETEYEKGDEMEKLEDALDDAEKEIDELKQDNESLRDELRLCLSKRDGMEKVILNFEEERNEMETVIKDLEAKVKSGSRDSAPKELVVDSVPSKINPTPMPSSPKKRNLRSPSPPPISIADSCDSKEILQNWKQLEETQKKLTLTQDHLFETQSNLATLEHKFKAATKQHEDEFNNAKKIARNEWKEEWKVEMEKEVEMQVVGIKQSHEREVENLRGMILSRDDTIESLQRKIEKYDIEVKELDSELEKMHHDRQGDQSKSEEDGKIIISLTKDLEEMKHQSQGDKDIRLNHEQEISKLHESIKMKDEQIDDLKQRVDKYDEKINNMTMELDNIRSQNDANAIKAQGLEKQTAELKTEMETWRKECMTQKEQLGEFHAKSIENETLKTKIVQLETGLKEHDDLLEKEKSQTQIWKKKYDKLNTVVNSLEQETTLVIKSGEEQGKKIEELEEQISKKIEEAKQLQDDLDSKESDITLLKKEIEINKKKSDMEGDNRKTLFLEKISLKDERIKELENEAKDYKEKTEKRMSILEKEKQQWKDRLSTMQERLEDSLDSLRKRQSNLEEQLSIKDSLITNLRQEKEEFCNKISKNQEQTESSTQLLRDQIKILEDKIDLKNTELQSTQKELEHVRAINEESCEKEKELESKLFEVKRLSREESNQSFSRLREEIAFLTREKQELTEKYEKTMKDTQKKEAEKKRTFEKQLNEKEKQLNELKKTVEEQNTKFDIIEENRNELKYVYETRNNELRQDFETKTTQWEEEKRELNSERSELKSLLSDYKTRCKDLELELKNLKENFKLLQDQSDEVDVLKKALKELNRELVTANNKIESNAEGSKLNATKLHQMKERYEHDIKEKDGTIERLKLATNALENKVSYLDTELESALKQLQQERVRRHTGLSEGAQDGFGDQESSPKVIELTRELDRLKRTLKRSNSGFSLEEDSRRLEDDLRKKLHDRDTTISALVKSSVTQESKILVLSEELKLSKGIRSKDASFSVTDDREAKNASRKLEEYKKEIERLSTEINLLQKELDFSNAENKKLRLVGDNQTKSKSMDNLNDKNYILEQAKNEFSAKLKERDATISSLVKASMSMEQEVSNLRRDLVNAELDENEKNSSKRAEAGNSSVPSWAEFKRLQQESEIFAGQIIEQDEEIEELRQNLKSKQLEQSKIEKEMITLKSKFRRLENNTDVSDMKEELQELEKSNLSLREEVREAKRKLRQSNAQADRVTDLESELKDAHATIDALKKTKARIHIDEIKEAEMKEKFEQCNQEKLSLEATLKRSEERVSKLREKEQELESKLETITYEKESIDAKLQNFKENMNSEKAARLALTRLENELDSVRQDYESEKSSNRKLREIVKDAEERKSELESKLKVIQISVKEFEEEKVLIETKLQAQTKDLEEARKESSENINSKLKNRDDKIAELEGLLKDQDDLIEKLTVKTRESMELANNNSFGDSNLIEMKKELDSLKSQKEFLNGEVTKLQHELENVAKGTAVEDMKKQLDEVQADRERFEKTMMSTYQRKLSIIETGRDATIDTLRKKLTSSMNKLNETEIELNSKINLLENENKSLITKLEKKMKARDEKINFLKDTLSAHEEINDNMKAELDQLQNGMENMSETRRHDVDELQQELMNVQSKATKYEREITALKMRIDERKLRHKDDVNRLKQKISQLETETPMMREMQTQKEGKEHSELLKKYEQLKWRTSDMQRENKSLREKLELMKTQKPWEDRKSKNDKWRNSALNEQIIVLQNRVKELEVDQMSSSSPRNPRKSKSRVSRDAQIPRGPR